MSGIALIIIVVVASLAGAEVVAELLGKLSSRSAPDTSDLAADQPD